MFTWEFVCPKPYTLNGVSLTCGKPHHSEASCSRGHVSKTHKRPGMLVAAPQIQGPKRGSGFGVKKFLELGFKV